MKNEIIKEPVKGSGKYKLTDIGVIPDDWDTKLLGDISYFENGDRSSNYPAASEFVSYGIPFINAGHVSDGIIKMEQMDYIPDYVFQRLRGGKVQPGDILFCLRGSLGKFGIVPINFGKGSIASSLIIIRIKIGTSTTYLTSYFKSQLCKKMIELLAGGAAQPNLGGKELEKFCIPIPTLAEQTAIATALSDADDLISNLEKLIEKKRNIKQGAMQQLLSPTDANGKMKKGWVKKKLGEVCNRITTGKLDANAMNPDGEYRFYTCAKSFYHIDIFAFDDEALLVSGNGENVGYVHYFKGKFNAYQRTYVLTGFKENIQFIKKYLDKFLAARIESEMNAGNTPYIKMGTLSDMDIFLPNEIDEQNYIAKILENMNLEIELIEIKLDKAKKIKQGMMQNLLTGKIRLV
jgi:type I restriction enzyme S subunit